MTLMVRLHALQFSLELFDVHAAIKTNNKLSATWPPWITENIKYMQRLRNRALNFSNLGKDLPY